jgi:hypothetical protein
MVNMSKIQHRKNVESLLNKMPKSYIPEIQQEIQQIHDKMKDYVGDNFLLIYNSSISVIAGKLKNKLSRGYIELFEKDDSNYVPHNPYGEDPFIAIERTQQRIERAWKRVQEKMISFRKSLENYKMLFVPIIESDLKGSYGETIKAIEKIPYDVIYLQNTKEYILAPYHTYGVYGPVTHFSKLQFDKVLSHTLEEMCKFRDKNLLLEIIPMIRKVYDITRRLRKLAEVKWKNDNLKNGEHKGYRIRMHNATGHITSGMELHTFEMLEKITRIYL